MFRTWICKSNFSNVYFIKLNTDQIFLIKILHFNAVSIKHMLEF